jgi:starch synthase
LSQTAALLAIGQLVPGWRADVVHANDWHTGLLPLLIRHGPIKSPATLFTIHNLAYQGLFPASVLPLLPIPIEAFNPEGIEFHGWISFLKSGIRYADHVTTVSPSYAREILTPDYGSGLDGLLRSETARVSGILNGIDDAVWDPARDAHLPAHYCLDDISGKVLCKSELQRELGLEINPDIPLIIWVSRITDQKMADVLLDKIETVIKRDVQLALLGQGDPAFEERLREVARPFSDRMKLQIKYEESLAHRLYAGGDILLHPTRFEPCGLTPLYAMRYGTLPVVRHVGGLLDTIVDASDQNISARTANGFAFLSPTGDAMVECLDRALSCYGNPGVWRVLQRSAMGRDFGWNASARRYLELHYRLSPPSPRSQHIKNSAMQTHIRKELVCKPSA